jgi:DNA-binding HxlR family transcriptional regulator
MSSGATAICFDGIVLREEYEETLPRVEYFLSEKGIELLKILNQLSLWNMKYNHHENTSAK